MTSIIPHRRLLPPGGEHDDQQQRDQRYTGLWCPQVISTHLELVTTDSAVPQSLSQGRSNTTGVGEAPARTENLLPHS